MAEAGTERTERIIELLRERGARLTNARRAVIDALAMARSHVTADDLGVLVQQSAPDIHISTIYRTLDALERLGLVDHVHLGHGRAIYHLTDQPHQHLVCEGCGAVVEVPDSTFAQLADQLRQGYSFTIRPSHFAVLGRCADCAGVGEISSGH